MRRTLHGMVWGTALLMGIVLTPAALAQSAPWPSSTGYYPNRPIRSNFDQIPTLTSILIRTSVTVPDGGTVTLGGFSRLSDGQNEFGTPGLGKLPGRGPRNTSYGRSAVSGKVSATVRIIDMREEEFRQTGVRSP